MPVRETTNDDTGIKVLFHAYQGNDPTTDPNKNKTVDILAVHGLGPHPDDTWAAERATSEGSRWVNWLQEEDMLPAEIPNARIMRHGYKSAWAGIDSVRQTVNSHALQLLMALKRKRRFCIDRPLIFVAHSFGGLVVLKALCDAYDDKERWPSIFDSTKGLVFLGTPFRGANGMEQTVMIEAAYYDLVEMDTEQHPLDISQPGSEMFRDLVGRFSRYWSKEKNDPIMCFYELQTSRVSETVGGQLYKSFVVNEEAGCLDIPNTTNSLPLGRTHFDMNKFARPTEDDYLALVDILTEMVSRISSDEKGHRYRDNKRAPPPPVVGPARCVPPTLLHRLRATDVMCEKLERHTSPVIKIIFSPDGLSITSISTDNTVRLWDVRTKSQVSQTRPENTGYTSIKFSPDSSIFAAAASDGTVKLCDTHTGRKIRQLKVKNFSDCRWRFSQDNTLVASAPRDGSENLQIWDVNTGKKVSQLKPDYSRLLTFKFSHDNCILAILNCLPESIIQLWDVNTGHHLRKLEGRVGWVRRMSFSADGSLLASGSKDGTVQLWDVSTGSEIRRCKGHIDEVQTINFSPDTSLLASASKDNTIRLWDAGTGCEVKQLKGHTDYVRCVAFSPDGSILASGSMDQTVRLWELEDRQNQ